MLITDDLAVFVLGRTLNDNFKWSKVILALDELLDEYPQVKIECIGFP